MEADWRIDLAAFLRGVKFKRKKWPRPSEVWDHDHCAACGAKFAEFDGPNIQKEGYATTEEYMHGADYHWVCLQCFADLKEELRWREVEAT